MPATKSQLARPEPGEYAPYHEQYISLVPGSDILFALESGLRQTTILFAARSERDGEFRYAPDKWSVKEVLGHISDCERHFAYRAMRFARNDKAPIEGFEQDDYVRNGGFGGRPPAELAARLNQLRHTNLPLLPGFDFDALPRPGLAPKYKTAGGSLGWCTAGDPMR